MTEKLQVYRCDICGNIVEVLHASHGRLTCCNKPMTLMDENTVDAAREKHVPVVEKTPDGIKVKVGSVPHPMLPEHHIEWVELLAGSKHYRQFLSPGQTPEVNFKIEDKTVTVREYCNLHGHWKG